MTDLETRWKRPATQARSRATQDLILAGAERLFRVHGIEPTSMQQVAEAADRSIGSLYHHFSTKDELVHAVVDRMLSEIIGVVVAFAEEEKDSDATVEELLRVYVEQSLIHDRSRPGWRTVGREAAALDPETRKRYIGARRQSAEALFSLFDARRDEIGHPDPTMALGFVIDQMMAMLAVRADVDRGGQVVDIDDKAFGDLLCSSIVAFLELRR